MEGYTNEEIAPLLNCSRATVERRLRLIRTAWNEAVGETASREGFSRAARSNWENRFRWRGRRVRMSQLESTTTEFLTLAIQREIDVVCTRFEAAWRTEQRPRIEITLVRRASQRGRRCCVNCCTWISSTAAATGNDQQRTSTVSAFLSRKLGLWGRFSQRRPAGALPHVAGYKIIAEIGPGRDGRRVQGPASRTQPPCGSQDGPHRRIGLCRRRRAFHHRGACRRQPEPSKHRNGLCGG